MDAVKASAADRQKAQHAHEARLQRQVLDWVQVVQPKRGDILCLRVPDEFFVYPGTDPEDITDEQRSMMETCHQVLGTLMQGVGMSGVQLGGAAIIGEQMSLEDLPPPWEKHPDAREDGLAVAKSKLLLPPGTRL